MIQLFELSEQELSILSFLNTVILNKSRQEYPNIKVMMDRLGIDKVTLTKSILELKIRGYIRQVDIKKGEEPFWSNLDAAYKISDDVKKDVTEWLIFDETRAKVEINKDYMWYAVYGSSVCFEKFIHHIEGGIFPFNHTQYVGCTDITHPIASRKITIPYRGYIGGSSPLWQYSGTMFLDHTQIGETLGRMYLIKKDQYEEIRDALGRGNTGYNKEIKLGEYLGNEIKTVTTKENRIPSESSKKYKEVVKQGLMEVYGKDDKEIVINYINRVFNKEVKLNLNTDCIRNEYYQDIKKALKLETNKRKENIENALKIPKRVVVATSYIKSNTSVVAEALIRSQNRCERCGKKAPVIDGNMVIDFFEVYYKTPISEGGQDRPENIVILCPNCQKEIELGLRL